MLEGIKVLHVAFSMVCTAEFENFVLVKQIYQLTIHRLSAKMCTFVHSYRCYPRKHKGNYKG